MSSAKFSQSPAQKIFSSQVEIFSARSVSEKNNFSMRKVSFSRLHINILKKLQI
jgi:hypothetical protein